MKHTHDEEQTSPPAVATPTIPATTESDAKERELLEREAHLNERIDINLRSNIDRDPRITWLLYAFALFFGFSSMLVSFIAAFQLYNDLGRLETYSSSFSLMSSLLPLVGAILSDSFLGKWVTLASASTTYFLGTILLTVFMIPSIQESMGDGLRFLPLAIIAIGIGFITPTIQAFGGDQFLPIQERGRAHYFALYYFFACLATAIAVHVRPHTMFFGEDLEFEQSPVVAPVVAACTALIPLLVMLVGRRSFRTLPPMREFSLFKMIKTTVVAAYRYSSASATERATTGHWLNFAARDHGSLFVQEIYDFGLSVFHILVPVFFFSMLSGHTDSFSSFNTGLYLKDGNNATSLQTAWAFYMFTYSTVVAILLVNVVTIPLLERRGWKVSLHRRFGAGYVCLLVAFGLSLIVNKVALDAFKSAAPSMIVSDETVESILSNPWDRQCSSCVGQWAVFPQYVFLALANALVVPTAYHIVYIESGRRLRTFAMAILLVAISMSGRVNVVSDFRPNSDQIGRAHYVYGGLAVAGLVLYLITTRFYTPRKVRPSINEAARQAKEAEYSKL